MDKQCLLVREFELPDPEDARFWLEFHVFYYAEIDRFKICLSGSYISVFTIFKDSVFDVNGELLGVIHRDIVPTTLDIHLSFIPEPDKNLMQLDQFCRVKDEQYDFFIKIFKGIKDLKVK